MGAAGATRGLEVKSPAPLPRVGEIWSQEVANMKQKAAVMGIGGENAHRFYKRKAGPHRDKRRRREGKRGRGRVRDALRQGVWE